MSAACFRSHRTQQLLNKTSLISSRGVGTTIRVGWPGEVPISALVCSTECLHDSVLQG